jgi:Photosystem II protein
MKNLAGVRYNVVRGSLIIVDYFSQFFMFFFLMGLLWYRVHTVVLNDPGRLISVHLK